MTAVILSLVLSMYFPSALAVVTTEATGSEEPYRVLDIGNSYTDDATDLLKGLVESCGIDMGKIRIYKFTRSSGSFKTWVDCYNGIDDQVYHFRRVLGAPIQTPQGDADPYDATLLREVLEQETWDLIVLHQRSEYAPNYEQWAGEGAGGYLNELLAILHKLQPEAAIGFQLVHSYADNYEGNIDKSSFTRWQRIAASVQQLTNDYDIQLVIPYGTAIESLRESSLNNQTDLSRDGTHLGYGLAQYTAACTYFEALIAPLFGVSVLGNTFRHTCLEWELADAKYQESCIDVTDENAPVAQRLAIDAVSDPYNISTFGIDSVPFDNCGKNDLFYNAYGIPVSHDYPGILIHCRKKYINRK